MIEGFHGVPYEKPMQRIKEYIEVVPHDLAPRGEVRLPRPDRRRCRCRRARAPGLGKPLKLINHPVRDDIPIWWASLMGLSVAATAEIADGWLPIMFIPERFQQVWGDQLKAGLAKRRPELAPLEISAGGMLAIGEDLVGDEADRILDMARPSMALYVGGMGARGKNFYNDICPRLRLREGGRRDPGPVPRRQEGRGRGAVPAEWLERSNLVGPAELHQGAGRRRSRRPASPCCRVNPVGPDAGRDRSRQLREIVDAA